MSEPGQRTTILGRVLKLLGRRDDGPGPRGVGAGGARPWPHLVRGWLDPDMPFAGWKATVDSADVADVLGTLASVSQGRLGETDVAEVLDAIAHTAEGCARAFRFGKARSFGQAWVGAVPSAAGGVKLFVLASQDLVERLEDALSVERYAGPSRGEYEALRGFFLAAWAWQWSTSPFASQLRAAKPRDFDPVRTGESMERVLSNPRSAVPELLRGLRRRTLDLLDDTDDLAGADVEAADAYLASRGAATLSEIRRRYRRPSAPA